MSNHSAAPWTIDTDKARSPARVMAGADCIAMVYLTDSATKKRDAAHAANLALILAAPDLVRLLADAKRMAEFGDINADMEDDGIGWKQWYADTAAALAKAGA